MDICKSQRSNDFRVLPPQFASLKADKGCIFQEEEILLVYSILKRSNQLILLASPNRAAIDTSATGRSDILLLNEPKIVPPLYVMFKKKKKKIENKKAMIAISYYVSLLSRKVRFYTLNPIPTSMYYLSFLCPGVGKGFVFLRYTVKVP